MQSVYFCMQEQKNIIGTDEMWGTKIDDLNRENSFTVWYMLKHLAYAAPLSMYVVGS
jgi:hypothetical protein